MFGNKLNEQQLTDLAELVKQIAIDESRIEAHQRASMCAYDCLTEASKGNFIQTFNAWRRDIEDAKLGRGHSDTVRNGIWVPAIPLTT